MQSQIFLRENGSQNESSLIASGSKDTYIRLWRFQKKQKLNIQKVNEIAFVNKNNYKSRKIRN